MCYPWTRKKAKGKPLLKINDECAICLGVILKDAQNCFSCGKYMHKKCLARWESSCEKKQIDFTCPLCRCKL